MANHAQLQSRCVMFVSENFAINHGELFELVSRYLEHWFDGHDFYSPNSQEEFIEALDLAFAHLSTLVVGGISDEQKYWNIRFDFFKRVRVAEDSVSAPSFTPRFQNEHNLSTSLQQVYRLSTEAYYLETTRPSEKQVECTIVSWGIP
jgi:hypothetical protein